MNEPAPLLLILSILLSAVLVDLGLWLTELPWWVVIPGSPLLIALGVMLFSIPPGWPFVYGIVPEMTRVEYQGIP